MKKLTKRDEKILEGMNEVSGSELYTYHKYDVDKLYLTIENGEITFNIMAMLKDIKKRDLIGIKISEINNELIENIYRSHFKKIENILYNNRGY